MGETKKVKSTGRFGVRYGVGIRKRVLKIEQKQKQKYVCSSCNSGRVKRIGRGIFLCKKCKKQFAGGAFIPQTLSGKIVKKMVSQKKFIPFTNELIEAKETLKEKKEEQPKKEMAKVKTEKKGEKNV